MADEVDTGLHVTAGSVAAAGTAPSSSSSLSTLSTVGSAAGVAAADAAGDGRWRRFAVAGYALHLFTVFALALSNILLALTLALAPRALAQRRVRWAVLEPVLLPMGFYLVFLT
ncbi:MAG TPA: hypothetical protein VMW75_14475, partial [Thermoanaerobaculia bacterium]|nr:hypothetical protein [Thermoanaerobaculia bacterium]